MALEKKYRKIIKFALLAIPVQVFFSIGFLLSDDAPPGPPENEEGAPVIIVVVIALIMLMHLILWVYNIFSRNYFYRLFRSVKLAAAARYISSYLVAGLLTLATVSFLSFILGFDLDPSVWVPILSCMAANTIILIILELLFAKDEVLETKAKMESLKMLNLEAKHEKLKQQLHPHFLFNSLNALKVLLKTSPENAETYLVRLADFLRFSIAHNEHNLITLKDELKFASDFLSLQQTRFPNGLECSVNIPEPVMQNGSLPVFSIQLLLENAIKHNSFSDEDPLFIKIYYAGGYVSVSNNLRPKNKSVNDDGLGLDNLSRRYKLISGDDISIGQSHEEFTVSLKVL